MYFYMFVSSLWILYLVSRFFTFDYPQILFIDGVLQDTGERRDLTYAWRNDSNDYEFYEARYKIGDDYCVISEDFPDPEVIKSQCAPMSDSPYITMAQVVIDENEIDVTEKMIQVAGPQCDFHDVPIDFSWLFPQCNGSIHIIFNDTACEIDIKTNTLVDGDAKHIPLIVRMTQ